MAKKKSSPKAKASKKAPAKKKPASKKTIANKKPAPKKKAAPVKKVVAVKKAAKKPVTIKKKTPSKPIKKVVAKAKKAAIKKSVAKKISPVKKVVKAVVKVVKKAVNAAAPASLSKPEKTFSRRSKVKKIVKHVEHHPKPVIDNSIGKNYTPPITAKPGYMPNPNNSKPSLPPPPSERKVTPEDDRYIAIKKDVLNKCIEMQTNVVNTAKKAMDEAQESANEEKGSTEEKFDSFRESMQIARDMHARQVAEGIDGLGLLKRISIVPLIDHVKLGAIVCTTLQNYFISASLGEIEHDGKNYMAISTMTPLYQSLAGKQKGDKFNFRDGEYKITNVF
ncbi:MAG TPA: hypothetical protein VNW99_03830 [Cytophagaceae bacterium]|jgi:hypothetical protein|nr:hypothetical protein [Cytophagaceae bacterium]